MRVGIISTVIVSLAGTTAGSVARAEPDRQSPTTADLDGLYLLLGPIGSGVYSEKTWDGGFGGEISLVRVREQEIVGVLGVGLGGIRFSETERGRIWADATVGSRYPLGLAMGVSAGVTAELDRVVPPRWGGHATLWVFAGAIPYFRIGAVQNSGTFLEIGLKIALPTHRM